LTWTVVWIWVRFTWTESEAVTTRGTAGTTSCATPSAAVCAYIDGLELAPQFRFAPTTLAETSAPETAVPFSKLTLTETFAVGMLDEGCVVRVMLVGPLTCEREYPYSVAGFPE
jgi:hypothetical protein